MSSNYKILGDYIQPCNEKNIDNEIPNEMLRGISNQKYFQKAKTNTIGVDLSKYRIVRKGQFAFNRATTRNGDKISIALRKGPDCIVSPSYRIFKSKDENVLNSEYLMMWFRRPEFDRYARYKSHGSAHEFFDYDEMCEVELPIPSIEKQREIVKEYNTVTNRIKLNEQLNQKLEETAQALYKNWFVDNVDLEKLPQGWTTGVVNDLCSYSKKRISINELSLDNYISTENMLQERGGVQQANNLPSANSVTRFENGNILISNIRPYFKKIWLANMNGGCSNDVLCFVPKKGVPSLFLYQVLEKDYFFEYVMAGSKGTKMPRGDKNWIMNCPVVIPSSNVFEQFEKAVGVLLETIQLNRLENKTLKELNSVLLSKMSTNVEQLESEKMVVN